MFLILCEKLCVDISFKCKLFAISNMLRIFRNPDTPQKLQNRVQRHQKKYVKKIENEYLWVEML